MSKDLKVGVHKGDGEPEFKWNIIILNLAYEDAKGFLDDAQYAHMAEQVQELAREIDPTHPLTQTVCAIEDFFELKDKGGPLGNMNVRVFFVMDKRVVSVVVIGAIQKQNNGPTPFGDKKRMGRRRRKYFAGDYGVADVKNLKKGGAMGVGESDGE